MVRISAAVMGIEFCYAAETAFVSPTLLKIGVRHRHMTLIWCLSPFIGFFLTPILGSLSDNCRSKLGRRRPFIILLSIGIILAFFVILSRSPLRVIPLFLSPFVLSLCVSVVSQAPFPFSSLQLKTGSHRKAQTEAKRQHGGASRSTATRKEIAFRLTDTHTRPEADWCEEELHFRPRCVFGNIGLILVPNGKLIGITMGDDWAPTPAPTSSSLSEEQVSELISATEPGFLNASTITTVVNSLDNPENITLADDGEPPARPSGYQSHPWGIFFTIVGTMLLDFDADACQSPSRAYLLDVTVPEDHAVGLSTFTIMAGLGGGLGYAMGGINWDVTFIGWVLGGHVRAVFTLVTFIFIACVFSTLYSFKEIPLEVLQKSSKAELQRVSDNLILEQGIGYGRELWW
ncbi:hypothetical protein C7M84_020784 [Penaeus vannamei]|uniref:Membrane-associated transporter protein n=1 Tax=Penaeus vannamei TaxID=6689 RepID=A0A3R7MGT6_PENVA|nr:hypothetical protein C7M84_020784 [Penaeus vannamei]